MATTLRAAFRATVICMPALIGCGSSDDTNTGNNGGAAGTASATSATSGGSNPAASGSGGSMMMDSGGSGNMHMAGRSMMNQGGTMAMAGNGDDSSTPQAPIIQSVTPMGGLHVVWTNVSSNCDKIELLRNKDGGEFVVAYTLTGAATSQHDSQVSAPGTYCYEARCVVGSQTSAVSAEKCGTP